MFMSNGYFQLYLTLKIVSIDITQYVDILSVYYLYTSTTSLYLNIITLMWTSVFIIFYIFRQNLGNFNNKII